MRGVAIERAKLYEQVWSIPMSRLSIMYGISDVGLAKACKRHQIPRPPRGYWARLEAGQKIRRPPLPKVKREDAVVYFEGWIMPDEAIQKVVDEDRQSTPEAQPAPAAGGPEHALLAATREQLSKLKPDHEGLVRTDGASAIELRIAPTSIDHCLGVLDLLIRRWEAKGGSVQAATLNDSPATALAIGEDGFGFQVLEVIDESKPITDPQRLTGKLSILINGHAARQFRRRWADTKTQRLEKMLTPMIETLLNVLTIIKTERIDEECVARQKQIVKELRSIDETNASREFYWRQELEENVSRFHEAERTRAYISAIKAAYEKGQWTPSNRERFEQWLQWAGPYADSIDPLLRAPVPERATAKAPRNVSVGELDLTSATRRAVNRLNVPDSDALWKLSSDTISEVCEDRYGSVWNELTRVLKGLGYDVAKRKKPYDWE